mgnify:CR=1 FL=1
MAYIKKKEGKRLAPGFENPFFAGNPENRWDELKQGKIVEVPDAEVDYHLEYFGASIEVVTGGVEKKGKVAPKLPEPPSVTPENN